MKFIVLSLLILSCATAAFGAVVSTPEIDGSFAAGTVALIGGGLLVLRSRSK